MLGIRVPDLNNGLCVCLMERVVRDRGRSKASPAQYVTPAGSRLQFPLRPADTAMTPLKAHTGLSLKGNGIYCTLVHPEPFQNTNQALQMEWFYNSPPNAQIRIKNRNGSLLESSDNSTHSRMIRFKNRNRGFQNAPSTSHVLKFSESKNRNI